MAKNRINHPVNAGIEVTFERISPEVAAQYLEKNTGNRPINEKNQRRMTSDMISGRWNNQNPAPIIFDRNGLLTDGQHRLSAVIESGCQIVALTVRGVDTSVMPTVDTGKARKLVDILVIENKTKNTDWRNIKNLASIVAGCLLYDERGDLKRGTGGAFSPVQLKRHLDNDPRYFNDLTSFSKRINRECQSFRRLMTARRVGVFAHALNRSGADPDDIEEFFLQLADKSPASQPIMALRAKFQKLERHTSSQLGSDSDLVMALLTKSWNAYIMGGEVQVIHWRPGGKRPEKFPELIVPAE